MNKIWNTKARSMIIRMWFWFGNQIARGSPLQDALNKRRPKKTT